MNYAPREQKRLVNEAKRYDILQEKLEAALRANGVPNFSIDRVNGPYTCFMNLTLPMGNFTVYQDRIVDNQRLCGTDLEGLLDLVHHRHERNVQIGITSPRGLNNRIFIVPDTTPELDELSRLDHVELTPSITPLDMDERGTMTLTGPFLLVRHKGLPYELDYHSDLASVIGRMNALRAKRPSWFEALPVQLPKFDPNKPKRGMIDILKSRAERGTH